MRVRVRCWATRHASVATTTATPWQSRGCSARGQHWYTPENAHPRDAHGHVTGACDRAFLLRWADKAPMGMDKKGRAQGNRDGWPVTRGKPPAGGRAMLC